MALDDNPPGRRWYAKTLREWGMRAAHADRVHAALFGQQSAVDKVDAVRLLLASVGISFVAARDEDEEDAQDLERNGSFTWECFESDWIGLNIRAACGVPLEKDGNWKPLADEDPYEDEDDEDGEYDRYDRGGCRQQ